MDLSKAARDLHSTDPVVVANAIYEIGQSKSRPLAAEVLRVARETPDERIIQQSVWALGKLGHGAALGLFIRASRSPHVEMRRAAYWSLGQIGGLDASRRLSEARTQERDARLLSVIGGALKTIRGDTPRAPASKVRRRAEVPMTADPESARLLAALENPNLEFTEKVSLRDELMQHDPDLFDRYMKALRAQRSVARALASGAVYEDDF